ncbi:bacterial transcription activator, effector binding domain [Clostridium puniceum]|uniref:Bacterial transcription activator, effector binding domain n=1 Tax=Clostridium puniceum TaxID=29367 RepID=A0A1S8TL40_9CLOT|nr:GyrI-like domain-containing protein [Clostridium puniceum]OOM78507.1 bacterial transcription activator, effector binding domain [Clostridium puniceum]
MDYEVVYLEEKIIAGIVIRTSNNAPDMRKTIGEAWQKFFEDGFYSIIPNKKNSNTIGLYTNYEDKVSGDYDVMICCEISEKENLPKAIQMKKIVEGKYAKFVVKGKVKEVVGECWAKIWAMDLDRKYTFDFEEYISGSEIGEQEIHIYIAIN